jgi:hypothetical protein
MIIHDFMFDVNTTLVVGCSSAAAIVTSRITTPSDHVWIS